MIARQNQIVTFDRIESFRITLVKGIERGRGYAKLEPEKETVSQRGVEAHR